MKRLFSRRAGLAALLLTGAALAGLGIGSGSAQAADSQPGITVIRYLAGRGQITTYELADALGWFKDKGIKIESEGYSQGGPESLVAMASGAVDVAGAATPAILNAKAGGAQIYGVMPDGAINQNINSRFFVLAGSGIKTAEDLKGKSIAVNTLGAHLDYTVREYLRNHGLRTDDVQLVAVPGPQLEQVLRHKQTDVIAVGAWQSIFAGKIRADGGVRVLFTDYDVLGPIVLGTDAMKKSFIMAHPHAVTDFVTISAKAADWSAAHPEEAKKLVAQILKVRGDNPELANYWPGFGLRSHALYTDHDAQFWIDVLAREGRIKPGQFSPADVESNKFHQLTDLATQ
jgi:ABC-type nitrate/sulfonate/bicarbonate transport system substrate-binding protein